MKAANNIFFIAVLYLIVHKGKEKFSLYIIYTL